MSEHGQKPEVRLQCGALSAAMFKNTGMRDGENVTFHSVVLGRSFRDGDAWRSSNSFTLRDIPALKRLIDLAYDELLCRDGEPNDEVRQRLSGNGRASRPRSAKQREGRSVTASSGESVTAGTGESTGVSVSCSHSAQRSESIPDTQGESRSA